MEAPERIGRWAVGSLVLAAGLVVAGRLIERQVPFWGGLVAAFGEAALVGGLADWFAVRALFAHPFGIPFPHTGLIPRNRARIIREIRQLVEKEWLPQTLLVSKVRSFDFVGQALFPAIGSVRPHLREMLRGVARKLLATVEPAALAHLAAGAAARALTPREVADFAADLVRKTRDRGWLEPVLRELVVRLEAWAQAPESRQIIRGRLEHAATSYRQGGFWKDLTLSVAEMFGGVDLDQAAHVLQAELQRFAADQLADDGQLRGWLGEGLARLEERLRDDPEALGQIQSLLADPARLAGWLTPALASLRDEAAARVEQPDAAWLDLAMRHADEWLERLREPGWRDRVNGWCQRLAAEQVEQHHPVIGALVEEQLNRLSEEKLTELIQDRVGEDLNWIRLNGTFVGGLIGGAIHLAVALVRWVS